MISAMPAVAVRRGRKKSKTFGRNQPPSHHSSITSLSRNRSFAKRAATQSISTISSTHGAHGLGLRRRHPSDAQRQRRRFLIYLGTIFLITGLLLVFIGVGATVSTAQSVGLLFIGIGAVLCVIKVFCSEAQATTVVKKVPAQDAESGDSAENLNPSNGTTPVAEVTEFTALPVLPISPTQDSNPTSNSHQNSSLTPTSLNSIPETQVLISDETERY